MLRIVAGLVDLPARGTNRIDHLLNGIRQLIGAKVAFTTRFKSNGIGNGVEPYAVRALGYSDAQLAAAMQIAVDDPIHHYSNDALLAHHRQTGNAAFHFIPAKIPTTQKKARGRKRDEFVEGTGGDIDLMVFDSAGDREHHYAGLALSWQVRKSRVPTWREIQIASFLWHSAADLHRRPLSAFETRLWGAALSPRLEQVLNALCTGDSQKQIARRLHLSVHTVNDYVKDLYARFGVRSRGEIMAMFVK